MYIYNALRYSTFFGYEVFYYTQYFCVFSLYLLQNYDVISNGQELNLVSDKDSRFIPQVTNNTPGGQMEKTLIKMHISFENKMILNIFFKNNKKIKLW